MTMTASVAIIGGGLMGAGIAQVFCVAGHAVSVFEPHQEVRQTIRQRIAEDLRLFERDESLAQSTHITDNLQDAVVNADFITEAAPEKLALKRSIFADLVRVAKPTAILASNTSVIPIHRIAENLLTADRIIGTHWWNPAALIPLVEVDQSTATSETTVHTTLELLRSIGKRPSHIRKDIPGFVGNRLQQALWREAIAMVAEGVCDAATLDDCVKNSFGLRLSVLGPLENADLVGLDLTLDIHETIIPDLNSSNRPHPHLKDLVHAGRLGVKSGAGFRTWTQGQVHDLRRTLASHLVEAARQRERY